MSDAAYEQRHKKHERAEKRLRRLEREALVRDRRRLEERTARLVQADLAMLVPALAAREKEQGKPERPFPELLTHLTALRDNLLADAHATLARYEKLLPREAAKSAPPVRPVGAPGAELRVDTARPTRRRIRKEPSVPTNYNRPRACRLAPTLRELAEADARPPLDGSVPAVHRRASTRMKAASAFGERVPEIAEREALFDDTMAAFLDTLTPT